MKDLTLPVIKIAVSKQKILSMDEYMRFVRFNLENAFDERAYAKWKKIQAVNVPFSMKESSGI